VISSSENNNNRITLPFLIIQDDFIVYASKTFCRLHHIDNHVFEPPGVHVGEVFDSPDLNMVKGSQNQFALNFNHKKQIKLKNGYSAYVTAREIKWNNTQAFQLFFSE
jgi:hypothetical protein